MKYLKKFNENTINEFNIFKNKDNDKEEKVFLTLTVLKDYLGRDKVFMDFNNSLQHSKVRKVLINKISKDLSLTLYNVDVNSFKGDRLDDVINYFKKLGLNIVTNNNKTVIKGNLSLNDLK